MEGDCFESEHCRNSRKKCPLGKLTHQVVGVSLFRVKPFLECVPVKAQSALMFYVCEWKRRRRPHDVCVCVCVVVSEPPSSFSFSLFLSHLQELMDDRTI